MSCSPSRMARRGWTRVGDAASSRATKRATWTHSLGWTLHHCGHPTALHPWILTDPDGFLYCHGATVGAPGNGHCWNTLEDATAWLELELLRRAAGRPPLVSRFVLAGKRAVEVSP